MQSTVEVRVAIIHDVDQQEHELIATAIKTYIDLEGSRISQYERNKLAEMLDNFSEMGSKAESMRMDMDQKLNGRMSKRGRDESEPAAF